MDNPKLRDDSPLHGAFGQGRTDPDLTTLHSGWTRLCTDVHGEMHGLPLQGFFQAGTLLVHHYGLRINGKRLKHTFAFQRSHRNWCGVFLVPGTTGEGNLPEDSTPMGSLEVRVLRDLDNIWKESILVRDYCQSNTPVHLEIDLACPIGDVELDEEMKRTSPEMVRGVVPSVEKEFYFTRLHFERDYGPRRRAPTAELRRLFGSEAPRDGQKVVRAVEVELRWKSPGGIPPGIQVKKGETTRIAVEFVLPSKGELELELTFRPIIDGQRSQPLGPGSRFPVPARHTRVRTGNSTFNLILGQAMRDLDSLRLPVFFGEPADNERLDAFIAGVPRYIGIFSRDIVTTAWQSALFSPHYLEPALRRVAIYQGTRWDAWRDEEPHRIPHERRLNPRAAVGETNRELYYGDVASTPFWIVTLATAYNWLGDASILHRNVQTLEECLAWIETRLADGNGFVYYAPAIADTDQNNRHHAWKDSGDAIVDESGRIRVPPLACVEIQGYCYMALLMASEVYLALQEPRRALHYLRLAFELKKRFNRAFWMPEASFFAVALDGNGDKVRSINSNVGHCIGTGIIDREKLPGVVGRLISREMFSGWGIRTLSSDNPSYDPFSYHRGSVWPVENATIAASLAIRGFYEQATAIIGAQLSLATLFPYMRLPEVITGHTRSEQYPVPGVYPHANLLQAWSVSAIPLFLQTILGIRAYAPVRTLLVYPILPDWLPWVEIADVQIGSARVDLRFWRDSRGKSQWKVLRKEGPLRVLEQPPIADENVRIASRVRLALKSMLKREGPSRTESARRAG